MARKISTSAKRLLTDSRFQSPVVAKFITRMMLDGKKTTATKIMYEALDILAKKTEKEPLEAFLKALDNVKPSVEVKSRRVGGSTYQVPIEIRDERQAALAMRWIINASRAKSGKPMAQRLSGELLDAYNQTGTAFKKKEDTHRMADANKAFAHYRW
ncbi:MAG: 30S ribosomal protein S7 [Spirochaetia bacterium]